jgi:hypothetical protein
MNDIVTMILYFVFVFYDAVFELPYFWVKLAFGIAAGLFIPGKIIGLLACLVVNVALFSYTRAGTGSAGLPLDGIAQLMWSLFALAGLVWWVVGRALRWTYFRIRRNAVGATP